MCIFCLRKIEKAEKFTLKCDVVSSPSSFHYSFYDDYNSHANNNVLILSKIGIRIYFKVSLWYRLS